MAFPKDTRSIILMGVGVAVLAGAGAALVFGAGKPTDPDVKPPAAEGGLKIDLAEAPALEATRELRCYVGGQFIGMATLADCAQRNGVSKSTLDVGLDATGALAAAPTAAFSPPPSAPAVEVQHQSERPSQPAQNPQTATPVDGQCLRYVGSEWRQVGQGMSQGECVKALYSGVCARTPGEAQYGRWNQVTLRLVPRRVEASNDNTNFRTFTAQDRQCQFPRL
ncbi:MULTISPECIES: hypothetical protein [unclassified Brevundimonas]|uniref:hypothetical protein n=1 Tax=unclassified Brevundimonas TaxID=2622653 RepID=UPI0025BE65B0|nr:MULTISPECIES: hypothetical protein [unclassified Brevundimonas]